MTRILPGVEIQVIKEIVPQQLNPSGVVAMIGTTEKGEVLTPTHVSSYREFADKFGSSEQFTITKDAKQAFQNGVFEIVVTAISGREGAKASLVLKDLKNKDTVKLIAKKSGKITNPLDIDGKKVSLWGEEFQIQPRAFFKKYGLKVKMIPQFSSVNLFLRDGVDVASAMWYNEYHTIINAGFNPDELTPFFFHEHGLNFPEDGIYALEKTFQKNPALSCAFVKATLEGWSYAFDHPEEALDIVLKYMIRAKIPANRMHQKWMLNRMKDLISPPDYHGRMGILQPADYQRVAGELKQAGLIERIADYRSFFTGCENRAEK